MAAPTPEMAPVMTWVVLTGIPAWVATKMLMALAVSAQKPSIGRSLVIFWPMVLTMRQPPDRVPRAIAAWARENDPERDVEGLGPAGGDRAGWR